MSQDNIKSRFDYFVVFAGMRTGSNFLESNLNEFTSIACKGEAFNPAFVGYPKLDNVFGITMPMRERNPHALVDAFQSQTDELCGFRYFNDHDPRILKRLLDDPRCGKIVLYRNPVESYVSLQIARQTGQWKLTNVHRRASDLARFDGAGFDEFLNKFNDFYHMIENGLQRRGQTAFHVHYDDLHDLSVINGMAQFLGIDERLASLSKTLKPQNPDPLPNKVENFPDMELHLANSDYFGMAKAPVFEPARPTRIPDFVATQTFPMLFMPIKSRLNGPIVEWMQSLDPTSEILQNLRAKGLQIWMQENPNHRKFTVLHHPLERIYDIFVHNIFFPVDDSFLKVRNHLHRFYGAQLPQSIDDLKTVQVDHFREQFRLFFDLVQNALNGQTTLHIDSSWGSQFVTLQGISQFASPDRLIRSHELETALPALAAEIGGHASQPFVGHNNRWPIPLARVIDDDINDRCAAIYARDNALYGFQHWRE